VKRKLPIVAFLLASASLAACATTGAETSAATSLAAATDPAAEDARLNAFLDAAFDAQAATNPQLLTQLGSKSLYDRLNNFTDAYAEQQLALSDRQLAEMRAQFEPQRLSASGRLSYRLFEEQAEQARDAFRWRRHFFPASTNGSPMGQIPVFMINNHRVDNVADAEAYVARLRDVERVMNEISANMRLQAERGIVPPQFNFAPVRADGRRILQGAPFTDGADGALFADFKAKVNRLEIADSEKARLIGSAREALTGPFRRGYETMLATWDSIEPRATGNNGAWSLPDGEALYAFRLRQSTTTELRAEEIHRIGLREVERLHGEMDRIRREVGFTGTLREFFRHVRDGAEYKYPNTEAGRQQYLEDARRFIAQSMAAAPRYFRRLPRAPLEVRAVEAFRQDTASVAFYNQPSADGSRPGIFYVNLADMNQVLRPQVEGIAHHEGAPGHHFQIALAQELPGVPKFRRFGGYGAYVEGWGLYAERLAQEMGAYQDPMLEFGMYSLSLWRAIRLVLDTGIHHHRWSRAQAIRYFTENGLLSERDVTKEVDRYFNNPGQATSYMIGQLKILELRDRARAALGDRFDIRDFHGVVLENGSVPLDVLEELVDSWIASVRG
jgi:uncharacterized protein (DUF885 family)